MAQNKLASYQSKRNFAVTGEPQGKVKRSGGTLRFCVQHHLARADHYDLRLEWDGVALSWAVPKGPSFRTADKRLAMRVEDHPVDYMSFEGVIPKGEYGGGTVMLWDEGVWTPNRNFAKGLKEGSLKFRLLGERLKGDWALVRMKNDGSGEAWLLIKEKDEYARETAGISRYTRGVRSGKSMKEIAQAGGENPFSRADVMLADLTDRLPQGKGWLYELKYDGHRTLAFSEKGETVLKTRNGYDSTEKFALAAEGVSKALCGRAAVLDGEMIVADENGMPDFGAVQSYAKRGGQGLCYVLFDLLALDGEDLRNLPLSERKQKLKTLLKDAPPVLKYSEHTERMTKTQCETLKKRGWEGIVAKRADAPYTAGKNGDWQKLKFRNTREFVVGGYTQSETGGLKALLVGYYEEGALLFAGSVGTGFPERTRAELTSMFRPLVRNDPPFAALPKEYRKRAVFLKPEIVVQTEYAEITAAGLLRQASFKGLREDKTAKETVSETAERANPPKKRTRSAKTEETAFLGVKITHPEKLMYPKQNFSKGDVAAYYAAAAPRMLPYLKERQLSLVCCPAGIEGEKFFRRHLDGTFAGVGFFADVQDGDRDKEQDGDRDGSDGFFVRAEKGVISLAQYNALEFHVHGAKKGSDRPDVMVFDLDPDEGLPLAKVRRGARELKNLLGELGLVSFLKTSGGKGYHIVVPFRAGADGETFKGFAKRVALIMEERFPADFTANMSKKMRTGKIFLDWQRNSPSATSVAPYSLRAREGAPVSMPIAWEELSRVAPNGITLKTALKRLAKPDPWADFFEVKKKQSLKG